VAALKPDRGAEVPEQVELGGCGDEYRRAPETSRRGYERVSAAGLSSAAQYIRAGPTGFGSSSTSTRAK